MTVFHGVDHVALTVTDLDRSEAFYRKVLGLVRLANFGYVRILCHRPTSLTVALARHDGGDQKPFTELRTGLDHLGLGVATREELVAWQERLEALGVEHTPIRDMELPPPELPRPRPHRPRAQRAQRRRVAVVRRAARARHPPGGDRRPAVGVPRLAGGPGRGLSREGDRPDLGTFRTQRTGQRGVSWLERRDAPPRLLGAAAGPRGVHMFSSGRRALLTSAAALAVTLPVAVAGPAAWAASTADQTQARQVYNYEVSEIASRAQTFTAGRTGALDRVDVSLRQVGHTLDDTSLTVEVRTLSDGLPSDDVLADTTVALADIPDLTEFANVVTDIELDVPAPVEQGTSYALVLSSDAEREKSVAWGMDRDTPYTDGAALTEMIGPLWEPGWNVNDPADDMTFTTYVDPGSDSDSDGYGVFQNDCDDASAAVNPGATEAYDDLDDDCDGSVDEGFTAAAAPAIGRAASGARGGAVTATARWSAPRDTGGLAITGYTVQAQKLNAAGQVVARVTRTAAADARSLTVRLSKGRYKFRVAAVNAEGTSPWSRSSTIVRAR
ncbi:hypothetical protein G7072_04415 [Nocardioides sp. HDW12B]|uniref:VOC family protein n=1 Tax=Nocardioides sp. HDW12B TaxID=2714939 RepID=UPI00140EF1FA|nr:VOC family protein [Nocardioides sp. HDW12B]QIK65685.1 hypothetical protein G7072_04415 [Nocardioides sp. HDW12B]